MKKIFLIMFSAAFIFVGCTALKPMTREEAKKFCEDKISNKK